MNSSFQNRWSFSYLKFTKYITNIIAEPKYKYRQQACIGWTNTNVLRPTPGDPWGVEQHHWNTGAKENQQLNPGGSKRKPTVEQLNPNQLILKMSEDMHSMFENLTIKMETMASEIEKKLRKKFANMLDKRINSEIEKVKKDIDTKITTIKDDLHDEIKDMDDKIEVLKSDMSGCDIVNSRGLNIVLCDAHERNNEVVCDTVNGILKDGLRLSDVSISKAERLRSQKSDSRGAQRNTKPGLIIASLKTKRTNEKC